MTLDDQSIEVAATTINWVGYWSQADFETDALRGDALAWSGDDVRRFVASGGRELPSQEFVDTENTPNPYTGAGCGWNIAEPPTPWWVEAQNHTEGPPDDESIPRKLEGWWRVDEFSPDCLMEVGEDLERGELCFVERLWSDRIRVFKTGVPEPLGIVRLNRVCDLQLLQRSGAHEGARWHLLRDVGEGGDDPDDIRVGQKRILLGGEYGGHQLEGMECTVQSYVEWMDRWTVEIPLKDQKGKNHCIAVVPQQLRTPKMPREAKPNGNVELSLALRLKALQLDFVGDENEALQQHQQQQKQQQKQRRRTAFRLKLSYVSRVRPGGRIWTACEESMYKYVEVRFVNCGDYGIVFRVLRMVDSSKRVLEEGEEDPHMVLDIAKGSDKTTITKAYRKLAKTWHPDKVPEDMRDRAIFEFRRIHQAYENILADPERSSDLLILKMQHPCPPRPSKTVPVAFSFRTETRCLTLVSQLRLANVQKLVEVGPDNAFIVTWPYLPEALQPSNECDGVRQVDRVDLVRQGWSDYSRSVRCAQRIVVTMISVIRHDVMIVDPTQNIMVDRETGQPLFIDFGRGETAGSIYATRIKTFMKKILTLLVRSVAKSSYDVAARFVRDIEECLYAELEKWQDEKTRDQKKALALVNSSTKWQEGIETCRDIWNSEDENPFRKMFSSQEGVVPRGRKLRPVREIEEIAESDDEDIDEEANKPSVNDDPEGYCDADISSLTPVQKLLRAVRKQNRRSKLPREKPNTKIKVLETLVDGTLGLGLDDADEDHRGVVVVQINKKSRQWGWEVGDRIIELNGHYTDDYDGFKAAWNTAKQAHVQVGVVFGVVRFGVELPPEPKEPKCLHCGSKGKHLQRCTAWKFVPEGEDCVYFCTRECQKEAWNARKHLRPLDLT